MSATSLSNEAPDESGGQCELNNAEEDRRTEQLAEVAVNVSRDGMEARITLTAMPEEPYPFTADVILDKLKQHGVVEGILIDEIQRIVERQEYVTDFVVAKGVKPEEGRDAQIELLFDPSPKPYASEEDDRIDWHEVRLIQTVVENQPLARKIPALYGKAGRTVTGRIVEPRRVRDARLPAGRGTKVDPNDPNLLVAALPGAVRLAINQVVVDKILNIPRDLDFSVGNINIDGGVQIGGNVLPGFRVQATGDVHVVGYVEAATIESEGSVLIGQGVLGQEKKTVIRAAKDVHVKFATNATIYAGKDINIQWDAANCYLESGGVISVGLSGGSRGRIAGGQATAATSIRAVDVGAESGTPTTLIITQRTMAVHRQGIREMIERMAKLRNDCAMIMDEIAKLLQSRLAGDPSWNNAKSQLLARLTQAAKQTEDELLELEDELSDSRAKLSTTEEPAVIVRGTLYPGVRITIGYVTRTFNEKLHRVKAVLTDDRASIVTIGI